MSFVLLGILNSQAAGGASFEGIDFIEKVTASGSDTLTINGLDSLTDYNNLFLHMTYRSAGSSTTNIDMSINNNSSLRYNIRNAFLSSISDFYSHIEGELDVEYETGSRSTEYPVYGVMKMADIHNTGRKQNAMIRSQMLRKDSNGHRMDNVAWKAESAEALSSIRMTFNGLNQGIFEVSVYGGI